MMEKIISGGVPRPKLKLNMSAALASGFAEESGLIPKFLRRKSQSDYFRQSEKIVW